MKRLFLFGFVFILLSMVGFGQGTPIRIDAATTLNFIAINTASGSGVTSALTTGDVQIQIMAESSMASSLNTQLTCASVGVTCTPVTAVPSYINIALTSTYINLPGRYDFVVRKPGYFDMPRVFTVQEQVSNDLTVLGDVYDGATGEATILSAISSVSTKLGDPTPLTITAMLQTALSSLTTVMNKTNSLTFTVAGVLDSNTLRVGGTVQTAGDIIGDTNDIQARLPAALIGGRMNSSVEAYATGLTPLQPTVAGRTLDVTAGGEGGLDFSNISGTLDAAEIGTDAIGTDEFAQAAADKAWSSTTRQLTGTQTFNNTGTWTGNLTGTIGGLTAAALADFFDTNSGATFGTCVAGSVVCEITNNAGATGFAVVTGTSSGGTTTTMIDTNRTEADADYWKGDLICFTSGNISGQCRSIQGFTPASDTTTFAPPVTQAVTTQTYGIYRMGSPWGDTTSVWSATGTTGGTLNSAASASNPWTDSLGTYIAGQAGYIFLHQLAKTTTIDRTLDVDATGNAGIDWSNVSNPTSTLALTNTTIRTATDIEADTQDIQTRLPAALSANGLMQSDTIRHGGTVQTGRDIGASVLLSNGTGAGQIKISGGYISPNLADMNGTLDSADFAASAVTLFQAGLISLPKGVALTGYLVFAHQTGAGPNVGVTGATPACQRATNNGAGFGAFTTAGISGTAEVGLGNYSINFDNTVVGNTTVVNCTFTGGTSPADRFNQQIYGQR